VRVAAHDVLRDDVVGDDRRDEPGEHDEDEPCRLALAVHEAAA
jgi:hypothetical protein